MHAWLRLIQQSLVFYYELTNPLAIHAWIAFFSWVSFNHTFLTNFLEFKTIPHSKKPCCHINTNRNWRKLISCITRHTYTLDHTAQYTISDHNSKCNITFYLHYIKSFCKLCGYILLKLSVLIHCILVNNSYKFVSSSYQLLTWRKKWSKYTSLTRAFSAK